MSNTVNNGIPFVPENTIDPAAGLNESLLTVDALLQLAVVSVGGNTPPGSPANGARYIVGTAPTGAWSGCANQVAQWLDGAWRFYAARYALNMADGLWYVRQGATWGVAAAAWGRITGTLSAQTDLALALSAKADAASLGAVATSNDYTDLDNLPTLGTAAATDATDYATAAQGSLADTAVQPGDLAPIAISGAAADAGITDAGSYYTSADVEGALQEVGGMIGDIATALDLINGEVI